MLHCLRRYYDEVSQDSRAEAVAVVIADVQMIDELVYVMLFSQYFFVTYLADTALSMLSRHCTRSSAQPAMRSSCSSLIVLL
jgi:hypothetical protein